MANSVVRPHIPEDELHAYCDGELSPAQRVEIAEHLLGCQICRSQHAMVEAVRMRASTLLAIAVPVNVRRVGMPETRRAQTSRRWPRLSVAIAAGLVGVGVWFSLKPEITGPAQLAAIGHVGAFGGSDSASIDSAAARQKLLDMSSRTADVPQIKSAGNGPRLPAAIAAHATEVDPVFTADWSSSSFDDAVKVGTGSLARVDSVAITGVRIHPSVIGGRPTFMVRQQLPDGHPIWVFEGLEDGIAPIIPVLQASGVSMSMVTRTKPDYVGTGANLNITTRMVTVVGYLPVDSLNALAAKVVLRK